MAKSWYSIVLVTFTLLFLRQTTFAIDPDVMRNFTEIIKSKGYPCETHQVVTEDGYILTVFRVPYGKKSLGEVGAPRPTVFLQHGLIDSSFTWVVNYPNQSLPYILADIGFDVWMGNTRGNGYSKSHVHLKPTSKEFWEFSWDEMAKYDLPAMINYALNVSKTSKIAYVGHSEGTLIAFAGLSLQPQLAEKLSVFIAFGPVAKVAYITNVFFRFLAETDIDELFRLFGVKQFLPTSELLRVLFGTACEADPIICDDVIEFLCGKHRGAFNDSRMPVVGSHEPSGTSVINMAHFAQAIRNKNFAMFDWGTKKNKEKYNQTTPPEYNLATFPKSLPTALFYGGVDELADPKDVQFILDNLPAKPVFVQELKLYAHLDFCWDYTAITDFYGNVISLLKTYA